MPPASSFSTSTPNGSIPALVGTLGLNQSSTATAQLWIKASGSGTTGWVPFDASSPSAFSEPFSVGTLRAFSQISSNGTVTAERYSVRTGANATAGVIGVFGTVNTTAVQSNDLIFLTAQSGNTTDGATRYGSLFVSGISSGQSFTIMSSNSADDRTIAWWIVRPT